MKILIKVTKEILERSKYCNFAICDVTANCAIALAVRELFPEASVGCETMMLAGCSVRLPNEASLFINEFDSNGPVHRQLMPPISFEIDVPDYVIDQIGIGQVYKALSESKTLEHVNP